MKARRITALFYGIGIISFLFMSIIPVMGQTNYPGGDSLKNLVRELDSPRRTTSFGFISIDNGDRDSALIPGQKPGAGNSSDYLYFSNGQGPVLIKRGTSIYYGNQAFKEEFENRGRDNVAPMIPGAPGMGVVKDPVKVPFGNFQEEIRSGGEEETSSGDAAGTPCGKVARPPLHEVQDKDDNNDEVR